MKTWWQSRTLWFNALSLLILILDTIQLNGATILPAAWLPWLALATIVGNAILRFVTSQPLQPPGA